MESCSSFIVVDEELSTVQFAHSSIKRHLLSKPTELDICDYHIDSLRADVNLASIAVTYLSLDIHGQELIKASGPSQPYAAEVPSFVVKSALPKYDVANRIALVILRGRKTFGKTSGLDLDKSAHLLREMDTQMQEVFSFLPYCQEYWLYHSRSIYTLGHDRVYELWMRLVNGTERTVEVPWAPEKRADLGKHFLGWITKNRHDTLIGIAIQQLWYRMTHSIPGFDLGQLEEFLVLLPIEDVLRYLNLVPEGRIDSLLEEAAENRYRTAARPVLQIAVTANNPSELYGNALHDALSSNKKTIAELLIRSVADVNYQIGKYSTALQLAATIHGMDPIVELLLENGAEVNARGFNESADSLLDNNAEMNARRFRDSTALIVAAATNNVATVKLLLEAGADVNAYGGVYGTALIAAVTHESALSVLILLEAGAVVESRDPNGALPLELAAKLGNEQIVKHLLKYRPFTKGTFGNEQEYMKYYDTTGAIARILLRADERKRDAIRGEDSDSDSMHTS